MQPIFARITKVDEETRTVTGRAAQEVVDRDNEIFDYDTSKPEFMKWSAEVSADTQGKSLGNVRSMHGNIAAGKLTNIDFNDVEKAIDVSAKIIDDNEWEKVLEGVHTGFSIGGRYARKWAQPINGKMVQRYTAVPSEISIVDRPCCPTAKFFEVHKRDGSVEQHEFLAYMEKGGPGSGPHPSGGSKQSAIDHHRDMSSRHDRMVDRTSGQKQKDHIAAARAHGNTVLAYHDATDRAGESKAAQSGERANAMSEKLGLRARKSDTSNFAKLELTADGVLTFAKGGPGSGPKGGGAAHEASNKAAEASVKANKSGKSKDHLQAAAAHNRAAAQHSYEHDKSHSEESKNLVDHHRAMAESHTEKQYAGYRAGKK